MKNFLLAIFILLLPIIAQAQSLPPGCSSPPPGYGIVWTAGQWATCLSSFQPYLGYTPVNRAGDSMVGKLNFFPSTTVNAGANFGQGTAPTSPINGDMWATTAGVYARINGGTVGPFVDVAGSAVISVSNLDSSLTITPTIGAVVASLNTANANTFTAAQTFTNSDIKLLGSSTGATTFTSANAGASNYTVTIPGATDTMVMLAASQTLTNKSLAGSEINSGLVGATYGGTGVTKTTGGQYV